MKRNTKFNLLANNVITFLLGMLTGVVITLLCMFLFGPQTINYKFLDAFINNKAKQTNDANNYEFYNLLPKMHPNSKESLINNKAKQPNKTTNNTIKKYSYYIQIGIFNKITEADELKAKLTLQGYETTIIEAKSNKLTNKYKLLIGPYSSYSIANVNKTELERAGFKNIFIISNQHQ